MLTGLTGKEGVKGEVRDCKEKPLDALGSESVVLTRGRVALLGVDEGKFPEVEGKPRSKLPWCPLVIDEKLADMVGRAFAVVCPPPLIPWWAGKLWPAAW